MENRKRGHEEKSREGNAFKNMVISPLPGILSFSGDRASRPRKGTFLHPPLSEFDGGARSVAGAT